MNERTNHEIMNCLNNIQTLISNNFSKDNVDRRCLLKDVKLTKVDLRDCIDYVRNSQSRSDENSNIVHNIIKHFSLIINILQHSTAKWGLYASLKDYHLVNNSWADKYFTVIWDNDKECFRLKDAPYPMNKIDFKETKAIYIMYLLKMYLYHLNGVSNVSLYGNPDRYCIINFTVNHHTYLLSYHNKHTKEGFFHLDKQNPSNYAVPFMPNTTFVAEAPRITSIFDLINKAND